MTSARALSIGHRPAVPLAGPAGLADFARLRTPRAQEWADGFVLSRELVGPAERGRFYRRVRAGDLARVRSGVYLPAELWPRDDDDLFLARIRAEALASPVPLLFGAHSAAALWRLPIIGAWPDRAAVIAGRASGGRSARSLTRRCEGMPEEVWVVDGLATTGIARTVVDMGRIERFGVAVPMADFALAPKPGGLGALSVTVERQQLDAQVNAMGLVPGRTKATAVVDFADGDSGSAGESLSRVTAHRLGFPRPVLQFAFRDEQGEMFVDFCWPDYRMIGEFDGAGKYLREEYTGGRSTAEIVMAEKAREDRLRALGAGVTRWGWAEAQNPPALRRKLLAAGLPLQSSR